MKKKIGILIDSSSTLDEKFIKKNNIWVAPLSLVDSHLHTYKDDGIELDRKHLISRLRSGENFKTAMTPIGQLFEIVEKMSMEYEDIIFLPISKELSGQWQTAQIVKKEYSNLHVINSLSAAYTNEIIASQIVQNIKKEKSIMEILKDAESVNDKTFTIFSVEDTSGMKSGGRITNTILHAIDFLKLQPIIRLNVKNEYAGVTKNYQSGIKKMIKAAQKWYAPIKNVKPEFACIYFSGYDDTKFTYIKNAIIEAFKINANNICVRWIPSCVLIHTKLGSYGFSLLLN